MNEPAGQMEDPRTDDSRTSPPKMPGWVKALAAVAVLSVVIVIVVLISSDGRHGPGRHLPGGGSGDNPPAHNDR